MTISIIVAVADNGVIGRRQALPWHLSEDLKRFKRLTMGHPLIMGRRTFDSVGRPLPGRHNIVVTSDPAFEVPGVTVARSVDEALELAGNDPEIFIGGGSAIFAEALPRADRIYLTRVHASPEGDVFFPPLREEDWSETSSEWWAADPKNEFAVTFVTLERKVLPQT